MASSCVRIKWLVMSRFSQNKAEALALLFILGTATIFVSFLWEASQPLDGTAIDLSERHQMELVETFKAEQAEKKQLLAEQRAIDRVEGLSDIRELERLLDDHKPYPRGLHDDGPAAMNLSRHMKENRLFGGEPPSSKHIRRKQETAKKVHEEFVKFYDPSVGKILMKPVIREDADLRGGEALCSVYDLSVNVSGEFDCMTLSVRPETHICLYPDSIDIHISRHIREEGIWEPHIIKDFQNILYGDPELGLIDIGANIGLYTLIAAKMGHEVLAVEPLLENIQHLAKAAQIDGTTDKITVIQNVISDTRDKYYLNLDPTNQGGANVQTSNPDPDCIAESCKPPSVQGIHMDDLLESITFTKAVLKIDIEGHEHRAFLFCEKLLNKVYVPFIYMEWMKLRAYHGSEIHTSEDKELTQRLVQLLTDRGYQPYSSVTMARLKIDWWVAWTDDIVWKHNLREFN